MLISREIAESILRRSRKYPVISLTGPRQSGKTTLARMLFPNHAYLSLERPDHRERVREDPIRFLRAHSEGVVLDEVQNVPELFSYIQGIVDESNQPGRFILSGSQNFLLMEQISQSLAGRVAIFKLLPFSLSELQFSPYTPENLDALLFTGTYPPVYDRGYDPHPWYMDYIQTYIERDVRTLRRVTDLAQFQKFMSLCSGRVGQLLNLNGLASECGISHNTARDWVSVLEASYIVFRLQPHHENFNKRVVKQSKLYFYDSGLLCALLGLQEPRYLSQHYLRGAVFESFVVSEMVKERWKAERTGTGYFWRDRHGHEVDYLMERPGGLYPVEIKSGETLRSEMFKGLQYWSGLTGEDPRKGLLIYGGEGTQHRRFGRVSGWSEMPEVLRSLD